MTSVNVTHPNFNFQLVISPTTTIKDLKTSIVEQLSDAYDLEHFYTKLTFGNGVELLPFVFDTNTYDTVNFAQYSDILPGTKIQLTDKPSTRVYMLLSTGDPSDLDPVLITSLKLENVLKFWVREILYEENVETFLARHNLSEVNYKDHAFIRAFTDEMDSDEYYLFVETRLD